MCVCACVRACVRACVCVCLFSERLQSTLFQIVDFVFVCSLFFKRNEIMQIVVLRNEHRGFPVLLLLFTGAPSPRLYTEKHSGILLFRLFLPRAPAALFVPATAFSVLWATGCCPSQTSHRWGLRRQDNGR